MLDGLLGGDPQYDATRLPIDEPLVQPPERAPGILLRIQPFKENQGVVDGAGLLQSVHDVTTNFRGRTRATTTPSRSGSTRGRSNSSCTRDRAAADKVPPPRRNNYANSEVFPVDGGAAFPLSTPTSTSLVRGWRWRSSRTTRFVTTTATNGRRTPAKSRMRDALTRRQHGRHASRLPARKTVLDGRRPVPSTTASTTSPTPPARNISWMDGSIPKRGQRARRTSGRQNHRTAAWPASVPRQHPRPRSLHGQEQSRSACPVAGMFRKYYNAMTEQGLDDTPVWHRKEQACEPTPPARRPDGRPRVDRPPDDHDRRRTRRRRPHPEQRDRDAEHRLALHPAWRSGSC